jgi:hypothetical protein
MRNEKEKYGNHSYYLLGTWRQNCRQRHDCIRMSTDPIFRFLFIYRSLA